jgi:hypothetical protein
LQILEDNGKILVLPVLCNSIVVPVSRPAASYYPKCLYQVRVITVFTVFRLLTDFVCLYNYEFWLSLCKIVRTSVILLLPLFTFSVFLKIYNYLWNKCLSPLMLWIRISIRARYTTLCDKVCQWLATDRSVVFPGFSSFLHQ